MKTVRILIPAICLILAGPALAQQQRGGGMGMDGDSMMHQDQKRERVRDPSTHMQNMREHMREMNRSMDSMPDSANTEQRMERMQNQMQQMHRHMEMMQEMMEMQHAGEE